MFGHATAGIFGYSHLTGGYAGGQAEYLRVPLADVNCQVMPQDLTDHQLVFLSDIFPTGYMAAEHCNIQPDDTVAVWGCGPVGQFTIRSAMLLGASAGDRDRRRPEASPSACRWPPTPARSRSTTTTSRLRPPARPDRRHRPGRLHRRRRHGGPRLQRARSASTTRSRPT